MKDEWRRGKESTYLQGMVIHLDDVIQLGAEINKAKLDRFVRPMDGASP